MITIEGIKVKNHVVPKSKLVAIWKKLVNGPFPRVKAYKLDDTDFENVLRMKRCNEDDLLEIIEWGKILPAKGTDACIFNAQDFINIDYIILIRKNPYHDLEEILEHELSHIAQGDL
jgi:hypothetical protein